LAISSSLRMKLHPRNIAPPVRDRSPSAVPVCRSPGLRACESIENGMSSVTRACAERRTRRSGRAQRKVGDPVDRAEHGQDHERAGRRRGATIRLRRYQQGSLSLRFPAVSSRLTRPARTARGCRSSSPDTEAQGSCASSSRYGGHQAVTTPLSETGWTPQSVASCASTARTLKTRLTITAPRGPSVLIFPRRHSRSPWPPAPGPHRNLVQTDLKVPAPTGGVQAASNIRAGDFGN
jgi:hypothetical protein